VVDTQTVSLVPTETVTLGGVDYQAKCTARTLMFYKEKMGKSLFDEFKGLSDLGENASIEAALEPIGKILWAMIAHNEGAPTLDDVYDLLPFVPEQLTALTDAVTRLFSRSMPQAKGGAQGNPQKAAKAARR
jgi:hypothetical protein